MEKLYKPIIPILLSVVLVLFSSNSYAQQRTVTGKVIEEDTGLPVPGVNVIIKGQSNKGDVTDIDGNYKINVSGSNEVLVFSFVGFAVKEIQVGSMTTIDVSLVPDLMSLSEVVVVGYGTQEKREVTGSIAKVSGESLREIPVPSFEAGLQGKAAGVQVIQGSGLAGSGSVIRIRGVASISASGDPLYVVDGIPIYSDPFTNGNSGAMNTNPLAALNPNDIESVEILKDAAATGIYGSRGANGVIFITTKRGKKNHRSFNFSSNLGVGTPTAKANMLNSAQYLQLRQEAFENDGGVGRAPLPGGITWEQAQNTDTDWWDETTRMGFKQEYNLSYNWGGEKIRTYTGVSFSDNESYLAGNSYERISGRFNLDYQVFKGLDISLSTSLSRGVNNRVDAAWSGGLGAAMSTALPIFPVRNPDDTYAFVQGFSNPVLNRDLIEWKGIDTRTINSININYSPIKRLRFNLSGNYDYTVNIDERYTSSEFLRVTGQIAEPQLGQTFGTERQIHNFTMYGYAEYDLIENQSHSLKAMAGLEYQETRLEGIGGYGIQTISGFIYTNSYTKGDTTTVIDGASFKGDQIKFASSFARINYKFRERYIFQATARLDGSSNFGPESRFGFFPTVSAAWIASEEDWMQKFSTVNLLKLKTSFGVTGNSNFPANSYLGTYQRVVPGQNGSGYGGRPIQFPRLYPNAGLSWETANNFDIGFELAVLNNALKVEFAFYNRLTQDVLLNLALPPQNGISDRYWDNVGEVLNRGLEFSLNTRNIDRDGFLWTTDFNIARNINRIQSIGGFSEEAVSGGTNDTRVIVGEPVGTNYLVRFSHVDPATGRPVYLNKDGEETFDWSPNDRVVVGNVLPDFLGGITNNFYYKGFELSALFVFVKGGDIYDSSSKRQLGVFTEWNMRTDIFDRWRQPGDEAAFPRLTLDTETYGSNTPWINTDMWLHDGSYIRLRSLSLGYTIPTHLLEKVKISNARVVLTGMNLLTFSRFPGLDPEIARDFEDPTDRNMSPNITFLTPPQEKSMNLSINLTF